MKVRVGTPKGMSTYVKHGDRRMWVCAPVGQVDVDGDWARGDDSGGRTVWRYGGAFGFASWSIRRRV